MNQPRKFKYRFCGKGPNGRNMCFFGCGVEVTRPRRNWCSDECVHQGRIRSDPAYARAQVEKRDHGVCSRCGTDTEAVRVECLYGHYMPPFDPASTPLDRSNLRLVAITQADARHQELILLGWPTDPETHFWECHHKIPVAEGGGGCGLDGLETLCIPCHRKDTRELRARLRLTKQKSQVL